MNNVDVEFVLEARELARLSSGTHVYDDPYMIVQLSDGNQGYAFAHPNEIDISAAHKVIGKSVKELIQAELGDIARQRGDVQDQLGDTSSKLDAGRQFFLAAIKLLQDPQAFYIQCGTSLKKAMNKVIFEKLFVEDGEITGHLFTETAKPVIEAEAKVRTFYRRCGSLSTASGGAEHTTHGEGNMWSPEEGWRLSTGLNDTSLPVDGEAGLSWWSDSDLLCAAAVGSGSTRSVLVGDTGIEPVASSV